MFTVNCKHLLLLSCFALSWLNTPAQKPAHPVKPTNSNTAIGDSASSQIFILKNGVNEIDHPNADHNPRKAWVRSAIIPGWGQIYNKQYWKVPLIYAGFALLGRAIVVNNNDYNLYVNEAFARRDGKKGNPVFKGNSASANDFFQYASNSNRNVQISIFGIIGVWGLNCIDAYISAKFIHSYSVDNNLSFRLGTDVISQPMYAVNTTPYPVPALKLSMGF
ncbi:DUF5683 domain-containing protein [Mucilaginibacter jinjuensis]|uniref:DUF5683 domain-containing protein n=1 Tax=Mucilaginibacter jinjuensis TaxID=1176721 RepID=A0ABY7T9F4_9SPHI|nr:DUF5683 domain-containing protein [Mucilaginibacter jinjuensis]WCT13110.1 DUF5683 domain-containing protein [Mucilaginibacter jinjuensis]